MPANDVMLEKVNIIKRCLVRIRETTEGDDQRLSDQDVQDIFVLNLQRAVQACIDLAFAMIRAQQWTMPQTYREAFVILHKQQVLDEELSEQMQRMCGFRNIAIHNYQQLNAEILKSILQKHLPDLEHFYQKVLAYELL